MPVSDNTRAVLEEMRKNGVDVTVLSALERELDAKPNADKGISDGVLAQPAFNSYKSRKEQEIADLKNNLTKLASLQGAANNLDGDVQAEAQKQVLALREVFKAQGYDLEEVDAEVNKLLTDPSALNTLNASKEPVISKEKEMPNQPPSNGNYVDAKTFADTLQNQLANVATGGIYVQTEIAKALREAERLGIELTDEQFNNLSKIVVDGLERNKKPFDAIAETLKFDDARKVKSQAELDAKLKEAEERGRREALKERGVTISGRDKTTNPHLIFDRKDRINGRIDSRVEKVEDLPKNQMGVPEYYRLRRHDPETRRSEHTANAAERYENVRKNFDDDGVFIGHTGN